MATPEDAFRVFGPFNETLRYEVSAHSGPPLPSLADAGRASPLSGLAAAGYPDLLAGAGVVGRRRSRRTRASNTEHLRRDFKYTLDGPEKPVRDPLADFLFVRKEGYCEYFASAMAVMLRVRGHSCAGRDRFSERVFQRCLGALCGARVRCARVGGSVDRRAAEWTTFDPTPPAARHNRAGLCFRGSICISMRPIIPGRSGWCLTIWAIRWRSRRSSMRRCADGTGPARIPEARGPRWLWRARESGACGFCGARRSGCWFSFWPAGYSSWRRKAQLRQIVRSGGSPSDASVLYERMLDILARRGFQKPGWFTPAEFAMHLPPEENRR